MTKQEIKDRLVAAGEAFADKYGDTLADMAEDQFEQLADLIRNGKTDDAMRKVYQAMDGQQLVDAAKLETEAQADAINSEADKQDSLKEIGSGAAGMLLSLVVTIFKAARGG